MKPFEILEHPADIGFRAFGGTLPELFENAALAMLSIAMEIESVAEREEYAVAAEGGDLESLLVNWLNEVLYRFDGKRIAFRRFRVDSVGVGEVGAQTVRSVGFGEPRNPQHHSSLLVVKGVTYHQLKVARAGDGWLADVYVDI